MDIRFENTIIILQFSLHHIHYIIYITSYILYHVHYIIYITSYTLHHIHYIIYITSYTLHHIHYIIYITSYTLHHILQWYFKTFELKVFTKAALYSLMISLSCCHVRLLCFPMFAESMRKPTCAAQVHSISAQSGCRCIIRALSLTAPQQVFHATTS